MLGGIKMTDVQKVFPFMWELDKVPDDEDFGYGITTMHPSDYNIPTVMFVDDCVRDSDIVYTTPIIMVSGDKVEKSRDSHYAKFIPVTISKTPKVLIPDDLFRKKTSMSDDEWNQIFKYITLNHDVFLSHWRGTIEEDFNIDAWDYYWLFDNK
jgi:hypothetical protein